ncbi:hypothetical protein DENSPDRAFT_886429 [Dentipellis sp. KUC8613]|nr:hypothetical protein DENSPDRAFT_886429 [Dentipellis sp. KUC8613]
MLAHAHHAPQRPPALFSRPISPSAHPLLSLRITVLFSRHVGRLATHPLVSCPTLSSSCRAALSSCPTPPFSRPVGLRTPCFAVCASRPAVFARRRALFTAILSSRAPSRRLRTAPRALRAPPCPFRMPWAVWRPISPRASRSSRPVGLLTPAPPSARPIPPSSPRTPHSQPLRAVFEPVGPPCRLATLRCRHAPQRRAPTSTPSSHAPVPLHCAWRRPLAYLCAALTRSGAAVSLPHSTPSRSPSRAPSSSLARPLACCPIPSCAPHSCLIRTCPASRTCACRLSLTLSILPALSSLCHASCTHSPRPPRPTHPPRHLVHRSRRLVRYLHLARALLTPLAVTSAIMPPSAPPPVALCSAVSRAPSPSHAPAPPSRASTSHAFSRTAPPPPFRARAHFIGLPSRDLHCPHTVPRRHRTPRRQPRAPPTSSAAPAMAPRAAQMALRDTISRRGRRAPAPAPPSRPSGLCALAHSRAVVAHCDHMPPPTRQCSETRKGDAAPQNGTTEAGDGTAGG